MPLINYCCECGNIVKKIFRKAKDIPKTIICEKCKKEMKKLLSSPSASSKITIDNGVQARSVEVLPNIIEINDERSSKDYREE